MGLAIGLLLATPPGRLCAQTSIGADYVIATQAVQQLTATNSSYFTGKVGIGATSPQTQLDVVGTVLATNYEFSVGTNLTRETALSSGGGNNCRFSGSGAGSGNSGTNVVGVGCNAAWKNSGKDVNALGYSAGYTNTGSSVNGLGHEAASRNMGRDVNALGYQAARSNLQDRVNALGYLAAYVNSGADLNAVGYYAGYRNEGNYCNFIGRYAGYSNTASYVNILGRWTTGQTTAAERTYLGGDLELYDPPSSGGSASGNTLRFQSGAELKASSTNLYVTTGSMGIGTNSPQAALHVTGAGRFDSGVSYLAPLGDISMGSYTNLP
jgi:hypothetical protein